MWHQGGGSRYWAVTCQLPTYLYSWKMTDGQAEGGGGIEGIFYYVLRDATWLQQ